MEIVSPRNKDRDEARRGLAAKMVSYLRTGAGVIVIDVVTSRGGNPHDELVAVLNLPPECRLTTSTGLSAIAYQPTSLSQERSVHVWFESLALGQALPIMPLAVRG